MTGEGGLPQVQRSSALFCRVAGTFYRGVNPQFAAAALEGSVRPGRYSAEGQPTLYLSSSPEGVSAAMLAHHHDADPELELLRIRVEADGIFDLRDEHARRAAGIRLKDAVSDWQQVVAEDGIPPSWTVRHRLMKLGAQGLMDPSRKAPGLWHLVLFRWDRGQDASAPQVHVIPAVE